MGVNTSHFSRMILFRNKGLFIVTAFSLIVCFMTLYRYTSWDNSVYNAIGSVKRYFPMDTSLNGPGVAMDDPQLINRLRKYFLEPPAEPSIPLNLTEPDLGDTSMGQSKVVRKLLNFKRNGFFVECGALDGETRSNTLYLERYLGWTGLLIEADPDNYKLMQQKHRKAWMSNACLSLKPYPMMVSFKQQFNMGAISDYPAGEVHSGHVDVQCFPLFTFLLAINRTSIDYFSLDVEGGELDVLYTVPFDRVDIKMLSVEYIHVPRGKEELRLFMESKGYRTADIVTHSNDLANDFIFEKKE